MHRLQVKEQQNNSRIDVLVAEYLHTLSRSYIQKLFKDGKILRNQELAKPGQKVKTGDAVTIDFDETTATTIEDIDLPILYEDDNVLVINKPVGVISHSRGKYWYEPSVASFVRQKTNQAGERAGIVHRLDRATSGVMICAKNTKTLSMLQKQFSDRKVVKTYIAVVSGSLKQAEAVIDMPIERNPKKPQVFRVGAQGKSAVTRYKVLSESDGKSLIELTPQTGRTHQLRVHLEEIGHPIIGDELYGGKDHDRLMLHAHKLRITIPELGEKEFTAPMPKELTEPSKSS